MFSDPTELEERRDRPQVELSQVERQARSVRGHDDQAQHSVRSAVSADPEHFDRRPIRGARLPRIHSRGGLWEAWLVFFSLTTGAVLGHPIARLTQGKLEHILYWASGLSLTYLQGALENALDLRPEAQLARRVARDQSQEE